MMCLQGFGAITKGRIMLERYLDINGREDARVLRHASLNSRFSTNVKNLVDNAMVRGLLRIPAAHGARRRRNRRRVHAAGNRARHRA